MIVKKQSCFIIMPLSEPFETYFKKIIKPAVDENNMYSIRGDSLFRSTHIMDDIWQSIKESSLVIAELTGKNPNVYYELGLAHALGKPAVLLSSSIGDVPFDLRPLRVLIYDKDDPDWGKLLQQNISKAIKETIDSPVEAIPHTFRKYKKPVTTDEIDIDERLSIIEKTVESFVTVDKVTNVYENLQDSASIIDGSDYVIGDKVLHGIFGNGYITKIYGTGLNQRVFVDFESAGVKKLIVKYAHLMKI